MGSAQGDEGQGRPSAPHPKPDRRAEALRANLKRRKAQTRARAEVERDAPEPAQASDASGRDG